MWFRFQKLYENSRSELKSAKEGLINTEMEYKKYHALYTDQSMELQRVQKLLSKKDILINDLNLEIEKIKESRDLNISSMSADALASMPFFYNCFNHFDPNLDEVNMEYEERIKTLEDENYQLKQEVDHYANSELTRLENMLESQQEQSIKSQREKDYYVNRCGLLERQNKELKTRLDSNQIGRL